jgi:hypothetical protein
VNVQGMPGLVVLDRCWSSIPAGTPQFHLDLPWRCLFDAPSRRRLIPSILAEVERAALEEPWSFIGLLGGQQYQVVRTAAAQLRVLDAARKHWAVLASVGARYTRGRADGAPLAGSPTLVNFCLGRQGAPPGLGDLTQEALDAVLSDLPGFRIASLLAAGDVDAALRVVDGHHQIPLVSLAEHFVVAGFEAEVCAVVAANAEPDPHGTVGRWLAGRGDLTRTVR